MCWLGSGKVIGMNVTDEIIGDIKEQKAGLVYLGSNINGKKFEEIRVMVIGDSSECYL
jgi:nicotinamide mononucleotide (NMN) deamidase PncC